MKVSKELKFSDIISCRLDRYIRLQYKGLPQSVIEKACRAGDVRVNSLKAKTNYRLEDGDNIELSSFFINNIVTNYTASPEVADTKPGAKELAAKIMAEYRIFDHEQFLGINKPSGLAVQGGTKIALAVDDALKYLNAKDNAELRVVHRLDKDTSGILLIAKTRQAAFRLTTAFKERQIEKTYIARLSGQLKKQSGTIKSYITKQERDLLQELKPSSDQAKQALTNYRVLEYTKEDSLVEFKPVTGRMHQLRLHAKLLGHPIIGDKKYGGKPAKRLMLHASNISFAADIMVSSGQEGCFEIRCAHKLSCP